MVVIFATSMSTFLENIACGFVEEVSLLHVAFVLYRTCAGKVQEACHPHDRSVEH